MKKLTTKFFDDIVDNWEWDDDTECYMMEYKFLDFDSTPQITFEDVTIWYYGKQDSFDITFDGMGSAEFKFYGNDIEKASFGKKATMICFNDFDIYLH